MTPSIPDRATSGPRSIALSTDERIARMFRVMRSRTRLRYRGGLTIARSACSASNRRQIRSTGSWLRPYRSNSRFDPKYVYRVPTLTCAALAASRIAMRGPSRSRLGATSSKISSRRATRSSLGRPGFLNVMAPISR